jgi:large subunit ribosomal protein L6
MSRIGKKPVQVPAGVKVNVDGTALSVQGPKGTLSMRVRPEVEVRVEGDEVRCAVDENRLDEPEIRAFWGLTRSLISNMVEGVTNGYEKNLEVVGVGWGAQVQGRQLRLQVGYANPVMMDIPEGLEVTAEKQSIKVRGADKQAVGQFAAAVRAQRKPEPYNGKGVKYAGEVIRRKQGKAFGS